MAKLDYQAPSRTLTSNRQHYEEFAMSEVKKDPSSFLSGIVGSLVVVKLHNGVKYSGNLQSIDGYMNIVLDEAKELIGETSGKKYGDVFIRGNNGMF